MLTRRLLAGAGALLLVTVPAAHAGPGKPAPKPKPQIVDAAGDAATGAVGDIRTGSLAVISKSAKRPTLQITLALGAAPNANNPYTYRVAFVVGECHYILDYFLLPGGGEESHAGCYKEGEGVPLGGAGRIVGKSIVWTVPLTGVLKKGATLEELAARTEPGGLVAGSPLAVAGDRATGESEWVIR